MFTMMELNDSGFQTIVRYNIARGLNDAECTDEMQLIFGANRVSTEGVSRLYDRFGGYASYRPKTIIKAENSTGLVQGNDLPNIIKEESIEIVDEMFVSTDPSSGSFDICGKNKSGHSDHELKKECLDENSNRSENESNSRMEQENDRVPSTLVPRSRVKSAKRYSCQYCGKSYKLEYLLKRHLYYACEVARSQNKECTRPLFNCKSCNREFTSKFALDRHNFSLHADSAAKAGWSCDNCSRTFVLEKWLKKHLETRRCHNEFSCSVCNRSYKKRASLFRHITKECGKRPKFGCAHCDFKTRQKSTIIGHLARIHGSCLERVKCPNCPRSYKNECSLNRHLKLECGKKPAFACELCEYKAKRKDCLQAHVQNKH